MIRVLLADMMDEFDDSELYIQYREKNFLSTLPKGTIPQSHNSIADFTGEVLEASYDSYVVQTSVRAWNTPLCELTCEDVRMLISQQMGLKWISAAAVEFVSLYPKAEITFYSGDFALCVLRAYNKIKAEDPISAKKLAALNFDWIDSVYDFDSDVLKEVRDYLENLKK